MCEKTCSCSSTPLVRKVYRVTFHSPPADDALSPSSPGLISGGTTPNWIGFINVSAYSPEHAVFGAMIYATNSYGYRLECGKIASYWTRGNTPTPQVTAVEAPAGTSSYWSA